MNKLLAADEKGIRSEDGILDHAAWQKERAQVRSEGETPSLKVETATEYALKLAAGATHEAQTRDAAPAKPTPPKKASLEATPLLPLFEASEEVPVEKKEPVPQELPEVTLETIAIDFSRPHGKRFGILVHAVLSVVDLEAGASGVQAIAELQGRMLGASAEEVRAASDTVTRALEHPLMKDAAKASIEGRCRREVPVAIEMEDGTLVEGNADLAFLDRPGGVWTVIDFKTDLELSKATEKYRTQVGLYALAIARSTNLNVQGMLLRV